MITEYTSGSRAHLQNTHLAEVHEQTFTEVIIQLRVMVDSKGNMPTDKLQKQIQISINLVKILGKTEKI